MITSGTIELPFAGQPGYPGEWPLSSSGPSVQGERSWLSPDLGLGQFSQVPNVVVSLAGIDAVFPSNSPMPLRVRVSAETVQTDEFNIRVTVLGDTLLQSVLVTWIAHDMA